MTEIAPMPYGKLTPSLVGSYNYNNPDRTSEWMTIYCPNCQSDNVCCLDPKFNPELDGRSR